MDLPPELKVALDALTRYEMSMGLGFPESYVSPERQKLIAALDELLRCSIRREWTDDRRRYSHLIISYVKFCAISSQDRVNREIKSEHWPILRDALLRTARQKGPTKRDANAVGKAFADKRIPVFPVLHFR